MEFRVGDLVRVIGTETQFRLKNNASFEGYPLIGDGIIDTFTVDGRKNKFNDPILELIDRPKKLVKKEWEVELIVSENGVVQQTFPLSISLVPKSGDVTKKTKVKITWEEEE